MGHGLSQAPALVSPPRPGGAQRRLRIVLRAIEPRLRQACSGAPAGARFGAVTFLQRFGSSLNAHTHFHCCIADGVFSASDGQLRFHSAEDLTDSDIAAVQGVIRARVLRYFARHGLLTPESAADMHRWGHGGGFSPHAAVRIEATDRAGLERLLRYCARPALAGRRLAWDGAKQQLRYTLPRPRHDGQTVLVFTPLELLDRLTPLIPPPRRHRHRYHGVFAPNAALRPLVSAAAQPLLDATAATPNVTPAAAPRADDRTSTPARGRAAYRWAQLLARIYACFPLTCARCGNDMRLIGFITEPPVIRRILTHIDEPTTPPPISPARGPPLDPAALDQTPAWDPAGPQPDPGFEFDQTTSW